jgi:ParB/RepB/Spo0J family partition protein
LQTSANIPLEHIRESPHNHRKHFDEARLQELAESVRAHGVLQPVLVRPVTSTKVSGFGKAKYELVYGHRRFRAARLAKLKEIPAIVRELDDKAALEVALIENCRREDVLPMEEAEGYQELHEKHGVSVEQLAERVGKSKEYVYGRLKLCALKARAVRKALDAGLLPPSTALLIARIPGEKLQEKAAAKILEGGAWSEELRKPGPMSFRTAETFVANEFMLQLGKAPFSTKDATLVPEAGACGPCPKRTGNCKELYPDVKSENVCTDPECFGKKKAAAFKLEQAAAKEKGQKLLKDSKAIWNWDGKGLNYKGQEKYVELTDKCPGDKKGRTFKELLGDKAQVVLAKDPHGKTRQLLEKEKLQEALEAAGHKFKVTAEKEKHGARSYEEERKAQEFRERVAERALARVVDGLCSQDVTPQDALRLLARLVFSKHDERLYRGWAERLSARRADEVVERIGGLALHQALALVFDVVAGDEFLEVWNGYRKELEEACALVGVSLKDLEKEQKEADAAPPIKAGKDSEPEEAQFGDGGED